MKAVYSNLKFLRFKEQLDALENGHMASPVHIRIKPINACNHDCWYCAYHVDDLQLGKLMEMKDVIPRDKMMEIIDDLGDMGVKAVTFSGGGEPTIYPHLEESINRLGEKGIKVASLTNGSGLKGAVAEAFARYGTWVRISIDGWDSESYAKFRNVKLGEFDRVIQNMRDFASLESDCVLGISYIVDQKNYKHVFDFVSLMKDVGVNHVKIMGVIVSNDGLESNQYHDGIREEVRKQIDRAKLLEDDTLKIVDHYHEMAERFLNEADIDCVMLAGRYTLLEQKSLTTFLPLCEKKKVDVILAAPFNSGILAGKDSNLNWNYARASEEIINKVLGNTSVNRLGQASEIANLALFLSSNLSSYINGQVIRIDGGMSV